MTTDPLLEDFASVLHDEFFWGREKHCAEDEGGSHYHCARCGAVTSMYGHYTNAECDDARAADLDRPEFVQEEYR